MSTRPFAYGLLAAVAARLLLDVLFLANVLPLSLRYGWYLYQGGDQELFLELAYSFVRGRPAPSPVGLGQALVMLPFVALNAPFNVLDIVRPLVIINGFIFGLTSVALIAWIARSVGLPPRWALACAWVWALLPLIGYVAFFWHPEALTLRSTTVPRLTWLNTISDGPTLFFVLAATALLATRPPMPWRFWALVGGGAALGIAVMFRIQAAPFAVLLLLFTLLDSGWRAAAVTGIGAFIGYLPQIWYHQLVFGKPLAISYIAYPKLRNAGRYGIDNTSPSEFMRDLSLNAVDVGSLLAGRLVWVAAGGLALIMVGGLLWWVWRSTSWRAAFLLLVVPGAYLGPIALTTSFRTDPIRFSIPAMPFGIILGVLIAAHTLEALGSRHKDK